MGLLRLCVATALVVMVVCELPVLTQAKKPEPDTDFEYLDEVKDFSSSIKDEVNARYSARINKMDMLEDYPHDDDDDDHYHYPADVGDTDYEYDDENYEDQDDEDEDDDDDNDDDEGGGCGGYDDDGEEEDEDEEELTPVQHVIEKYFTR